MFTCRSCGHDDMVHRNFVGCCGHDGCPCTKMDGREEGRCEEHGAKCWWAKPRKIEKPEHFRVELVSVSNGHRYKVFVDGEWSLSGSLCKPLVTSVIQGS